MEEIRITVEGRQVRIEANVSKKRLLDILDKAKLKVKLSISKEKEDELTGTRWKVMDEESQYYRQILTIQSIHDNDAYLKFDLDDNLIKCSIDKLPDFARMIDE